MNILVQLSRFITGVLFIFSGFIKLNDPYGFAYKLEEYFQVFAQDFGDFFLVFEPLALPLSFAICVLEIVLGVAVLIFYRMRITTWIVLILIVFFTFLTFYSAAFDKVKECGCFGDFLPLTPWQSFIKDLFLLVLALILFARRKSLDAGFNNLKGDFVTGISAVIFILVGWYSLAHLPYFDFRPYATGKNIREQMQAEESPEYVYRFTTPEGEVKEYSEWPDNYKEMEYDTSIVANPDKAFPKITDFMPLGEMGDYTDTLLQGNTLLVVLPYANRVLYNESAMEEMEEIGNLVKDIEGSVKSYILSSSPAEEVEEVRHQSQIPAPYLSVDETVLKTMIRSNPGLILLKDGTVAGKWHYNDIPDSEQVLLMVQN